MPESIKHIPMRKCIVCRESFPQSEMYRFTHNDTKLNIDIDNRSSGRGCYVCKSSQCIEAAFRKNAFAKSFRTSISRDEFEIIGRYLNAK